MSGTMLIIRGLLLLGLAVFMGCLVWPKHTYGPAIPGHHWSCDSFSCELYDEKGGKTASIVGTLFGASDGAQVCIFDSPGTCKTFETDQQAFAYVVQVYGERERKTE